MRRRDLCEKQQRRSVGVYSQSRQPRLNHTRSRCRGLQRRVASRSRARARGVSARATVIRSRRGSHRVARQRGATNTIDGVALGGGGARRRSSALAGHAPSFGRFGTLAAYGLGATAVALGIAAALTTYKKRPAAPVLESVAAVRRARDALARATKQDTAGSAAVDLTAVQNTAEAAANAAVEATRATETLHRVSDENVRLHTPASETALQNAITEFVTTEATAEKTATNAAKKVERAKARGGWPKKTLAALLLVAGALTGLKSALQFEPRYAVGNNEPQLEQMREQTEPQLEQMWEKNEPQLKQMCDTTPTFPFQGLTLPVTTVLDRSRTTPGSNLYEKAEVKTYPRIVGQFSEETRSMIENTDDFYDWVQSNKNCLAPEFKSPADKLYSDLLYIKAGMVVGPRQKYKKCGHNNDGFFYIEANDDTNTEKQFPEDIQGFFTSRKFNLNDPKLYENMFKSLTEREIDKFTS